MLPSFSDPFLASLLLIPALFFLIKGADYVVDKAVLISQELGIAEVIIGLTVISIGTSLPEISAHLMASINIIQGTLPLETASSTVLGTNIGSDIIQQLLLVGLVGLMGHLTVSRNFLKRDFALFILSGVLLLVFAFDSFISKPEGFFLVLVYLFYLAYLLNQRDSFHDLEKKEQKAVKRDFLSLVLGLGIVLISAHVVLVCVQVLVEKFQIGGSLIGVLVIGVATALPELSAALAGVKKGEESISLGVLIGSNITNPLFALGLGALISGYSVPGPVLVFDLPVKVITSILLLGLLYHHMDLGKKSSLTLIVTYFVYLALRVTFFP